MKKLILFSLLFLISSFFYCQQLQTNTILTKEEYIKKGKSQKVVGLVFLAAGIATLSSTFKENTKFDILPTVVIGGILAVLASISLFKAAENNLEKAQHIKLSFKLEQNQFEQISQLGIQTIPAISVKLNL